MIQALGSQHRGNAMQMHFAQAEQWAQMKQIDIEKYLDRLDLPPASRARWHERSYG